MDVMLFTIYVSIHIYNGVETAVNIACSSRLITDQTIKTYYIAGSNAPEVRFALEQARTEIHATVRSGEVRSLCWSI